MRRTMADRPQGLLYALRGFSFQRHAEQSRDKVRGAYPTALNLMAGLPCCTPLDAKKQSIVDIQFWVATLLYYTQHIVDSL